MQEVAIYYYLTSAETSDFQGISRFQTYFTQLVQNYLWASKMIYAEKQQYIAVPNFEARHLPTHEDTKWRNLQLLEDDQITLEP